MPILTGAQHRVIAARELAQGVMRAAQQLARDRECRAVRAEALLDLRVVDVVR